MKKKLTIGLLSTCSLPGDVSGNLDQIRRFAEKAGINHCDILLTPELSVTGYGGYPEVLACAEPAGDGEVYRTLCSIAADNTLVILAGFVERDGTKRYLSHYVVYPDGTYLVQRKHRVTPMEHPLDPAVTLYYDGIDPVGQVHPGDEQFCLFEVCGVKCAVAVCADVGVPHLHELLDRHCVEALFVPVGAGGTRENKVTAQDLKTAEGIDRYLQLFNNEYFFPEGLIRDAIAHNRCISIVNMCGYDGKGLYHGGSGSVIDPYGGIAAFLPGIENIDRQRPVLVFGEVEFESL